MKDSTKNHLVEQPRSVEIRLRFRADINPSKSEVSFMPGDTPVSFVPMESVGEFGGLRLDSIKEIDEVAEGYTYFRDGDVVVAKITPCFENGKGAIGADLENGIAFGTTELHVLRPSCGLDGRFLFYVTLSDEFRKIGASYMYGAGGQKRIPTDFVKDFRVLDLGLPEQRAIAAFLDRETARIDALIERKERQIALLQEKRTVLICHAVTRGLDHNAKMKNSGIDWLGEVPANWEVRRLRRDVLTIEQGWSPQCDNLQAEIGDWGVLKVGCVNGVEFDENENKRLPADLEPKVRYEIKAGDVLMSRANTKELLGNAIVVNRVRPRLILCDKLYRIRFHEEQLAPEFAVMMLGSSSSRYQLERDASGTSGSMQNIGQDTIKQLLYVRPPVSEQSKIISEINRRCASMDLAKGKISHSVSLLREYRSALISAAVTGIIDVQNEAV